ncbi:MAG: hypothetical protein ACAI25_07815 [Planctomycetota bacterium]
MPNRRPARLAVVALTLSLGLSACRATGTAADGYFEWGGRTFTTNPVSCVPYYLGFVPFFIAGIPLDLITWIMTGIGWSNGSGPIYNASCMSPSIFLGVTGGTILAAPFFPFGLPWWDPEREDHEAPLDEPKKKPQPAPEPVAPSTVAPAPTRERDPDEIPAGAPRR